MGQKTLSPEQEKELDGFVLEMEQDQLSPDEIKKVVRNYIDQNGTEGKTGGAQGDAAAAPDTESASEEPSLESPEEREEKRAAKEHAYRQAHANLPGGVGIVGLLPDALLEPYAAFESTLLGFVSGVSDFAVQQSARFDDEFQDQLEEASPEERMEMWQNYNQAGDEVREAVEASQFAEERGSGSISTELAEGNLANAAQLTVNQTASGLASLVPFMIPGGQVLGPAILGSSAAAGAFEEDIADIEKTGNATINEIYTASYLKGGVEFATEFVTAGIIGKAQKFAAGGASKKAVNDFTKSAWRHVWGDTWKEGVSEGLADTGSKLVDSAVYGTEFNTRDAVTGFIDSAIVGAIVGGKVATYGQIANPGVGQDLAAQTLKSPEQKEASEARAKKIQEAQVQKEEVNNRVVGTEKSLIDQQIEKSADQTIAETIEEEKAAHKEHKRVLNDMTPKELREYADNLDKANKLEAEKKADRIPEESAAVVDEQIERHRQKQTEAYNTVQNWRETSEAINEADKALDEAIEKDEAALKDSAKPAPKVDGKKAPEPTEKKKLADKEAKERVKVNKKKKEDLAKEKKAIRPEHVDNRTTPVPVAPVVGPKPVVDKAARDQKNSELIPILKDPNVPDGQKESKFKEFFKVNAPLVTSIAKTAASRAGIKDFASVRSLVESMIADAILSPKKKEVVSLDNKFYTAVAQNVYRELKTEQQSTPTVDKSKELKEDLDYIDELLADGVINEQDAELERRHAYAKHGGESSTAVDLDTKNQKDEAAINNLYDNTEPEIGELEGINAILDGKTVDNLLSDIKNNTEKIFALLPEFSRPKSAFDGIFADGNPPIEIWESYFKGNRKRKGELKKRIKDRIEKVRKAEAPSTDNLNPGQANDVSMDFLEQKREGNNVKTFLPLLAKLKRSFPGTKIIISKARMIEDFIEAGIDPQKAETVKGYTDGNVVVLNPEKLDFETPIHEFGHIWAQTARKERPELYAKGEEVIRQSPYWIELLDKRDNQPDSVYYGYSDARLLEEAMATAIGQKGDQIFKQPEQQKIWDKLRQQIFDFVSAKLGIAKVEDLTLDQFVTLAATEIVTGNKFIQPADVVAVDKSIMTLEALEVGAGATRNYSRNTKPVTEYDTHKEYKQKVTEKQVYDAVNRYQEELSVPGAWFGITTGNYAETQSEIDSLGSKYNKGLNDKIAGKVKGLKKVLSQEGYIMKRDPINPGFHQVYQKPKFEFSEADPKDTGAQRKDKILQKLLNGKHTFKDKSPYKKSKIDQETREVLDATKRDFALRGHTLTPAQIDGLIVSLQDLIEQGSETQKEKRSNLKKVKEQVKETTKGLIKETSGIDSETLTPTRQERLANEKRNVITDLRKGKIGSAFSRLLSPDSNNDFYGLLFNLIPTGKGRNAAKDFIKKTITDPLENGNYQYLQAKGKFKAGWEALLQEAMNGRPLDLVGKTPKQIRKAKQGLIAKANSLLAKESSVVVEGETMTNSQVAKIYNYIKDPSLHKQLIKGGVSNEVMTQVINYVRSNPQLSSIAEGVPGIYSGPKTVLNSKLDEHGYRGVKEGDIVPFKDALKKKGAVKEDVEARYAILSDIYNGQIPATAPYTPFTAVGADTTLDVDSVFEGEGDYYSVMSGNLKKRTSAGAVNLFGKSLETDIESYANGPLRTMSYLDFAKGASDVFSSNNLKAMEAAYGKSWADSTKESIKAIITGRNSPVNDTSGTRFLTNWVNNTVGGIMFFNSRSAVLQLISFANYGVENPVAFTKALTSKNKKKAVELIENSEWFKERGKGKALLEYSEIFGQEKKTLAGKALNETLQLGYALTRAGDKKAIMFGGSAYIAMRLDQGIDPEVALKEFILKSEEVQQSSAPERVGREQRNPLGRAVLAFANTPMQYNRKMQKGLKDVLAPGSTREQKVNGLKNILYYGALQNAIFTTMQRALWTALDFEDDEDDDKLVGAVNSMIDTILRGSGIIGAAFATAKNILFELSKEDNRRVAEKSTQALLNTVPALGTKARQLKKAVSGPVYSDSDGPIEVPGEVIQAANAVTFISNIPADRAIKKFEGVNDAFNEDLEIFERLMRLAGWDRYGLGLDSVKK